MRLLLDQNLSRRLVAKIASGYPDSTHVAEVGLDTASDRTIWEWAGERDYVVVSKDTDFRQLAFLYGPPPKVVWLRVGNVPTAVIEALLLGSVERVARFVAEDEEALLVISPGD